MNKQNDFFTFKGYQLNHNSELTSSMEDYIEMLYRIQKENGSVRAVELSHKLNVKAPSVSKMIDSLNKSGYTFSEKYGEIYLTAKGIEAGRYFLYRHNIIHKFLCALNHSENELEQTEKIEHFLNHMTIKNLERLTEKLN